MWNRRPTSASASGTTPLAPAPAAMGNSVSFSMVWAVAVNIERIEKAADDANITRWMPIRSASGP